MDQNDGQRLSRLQVDRYLTGELSEAEAASVGARLTPADAQHVAAVGRARAELPPFDPVALRARAQPPANNTVWFRAVGALAAVAAVVLVALRLSAPSDEVLYRGPGLHAFVVTDGRPVPYDGDALGAGDALAFQVAARDHDGVVLLSIDGTGALTVFYPAEGDAPEPLAGPGPRAALPDTVVLDGAPGPEVFVAVFDRSVSQAQAMAAARYREGGADALLAWADESDDVDAVEVERR